MVNRPNLTANFFAVIPAGGSGQRMQADKPKALLELNKLPLLAHSVSKFLAQPEFIKVVVPVPQDFLEFCIQKNSEWFGDQSKRLVFIQGGDTRQESVKLGLDCLLTEYAWPTTNQPLTDLIKEGGTSASTYVLIHDAARCLLSDVDLKSVMQAVVEKQAVSLGVPVVDSVKQAAPSGKVLASLDRDSLWQVQTPQAFKFELIYKAHQLYQGKNFSDDAAMVEPLHSVYMLKAEQPNFKITTPTDLLLADLLLADIMLTENLLAKNQA